MVVKKIIPQKPAIAIKRFTLDTVSKFATKGTKNLSENLFLFPNRGLNFKLWEKNNKRDYYIVDSVNFSNNRTGKLTALFYKDGLPMNKIETVKNTMKQSRWNFEPNTDIFKTDNNVEYDINKTEKLIEEKKKLLAKRNELLGITDYGKKAKEELKKKKSEVKGKKK